MSTRMPDRVSSQGSTQVSRTHSCGASISRLSPSLSTAANTVSRCSGVTPKVTSTVRVRRGSPWIRTACPPITMYGRSRASNSQARRAIRDSNIQCFRQLNFVLYAFERERLIPNAQRTRFAVECFTSAIARAGLGGSAAMCASSQACQRLRLRIMRAIEAYCALRVKAKNT